LVSIFATVGTGTVAAPPTHAANDVPDEIVSKDGAYVIDTRSKLVWLRCTEGMYWDGLICAGTPQRFSFTQARAVASAKSKADGLPWRLPRASELRHLVNNKATTPTGPDPVLFPGTPSDWHWSGSATIETKSINVYDYDKARHGHNEKTADRMAFLYSWAVHLETGEARNDMPKTSLLPVRLVRQYD
jgi:hypothetical protein